MSGARIIWWRVLIYLTLVYVAIRVGIPFLVAHGVPFEIRAVLLALLPLLGYRLGPVLFTDTDNRH